MAEPKIVFCNNNHIYDAAINNECPYCKKIASDQKELSDSVNGVSRKRTVRGLIDEYTELISREAEDEYTELITKETEFEDDSTELISKEVVVEDEHTELIRHGFPIESAAVHSIQEFASQSETDLGNRNKERVSEILKNDGKVIGWLVLKNGSNAGHSIEICQKTKYIYEFQGSCITSSESNDEMRLLATIENDDALSIIPGNGVSLTVNGADKTMYRFLCSYDELQLGTYYILYIEIMAHFMKWED